MGLPGPYYVILRSFLLEHIPHRFDVVAREPPVPPGFQVPQVEFLGLIELDARYPMADLAGDELQSPARALVVKQDPGDRVQVIGLAVVDRDPVSVHLGNPIWAARI